MFARLKKDIQVVFERDPAAKSTLEVILCYPGFHAILVHRISHWLYQKKLFLLARLVSQAGRALTQIEIHPGAVLGEGLFIDHGAGVVIGETTEIGDNVTLYQGVTLGGTGKEKGKRHPTIGNSVVISAGAKILGSFVIGDNVKIGAGSVVLREVPPHCTVVGVPGYIVKRDDICGEAGATEGPSGEASGSKDSGRPGIDLRHNELPNPVAELLQKLQEQMAALENKIEQLEASPVDKK